METGLVAMETSLVARETSGTTSGSREEVAARRPRRRAAAASSASSTSSTSITSSTASRRSQRGRRRGLGEKRRGQKERRRGQEEKKEGVTVKRTWSDGKRRWDKKHYCVFCRRPQVKIARHLLRKHADQQEVAAASTLPTGSKQRHLLLEHLRCRGNYLHNIEVIRQGSGEIVPWRQPSQEVDARNYLPCPLCLGFFLRADLWKHQASCRRKISKDPGKESRTRSEPGKESKTGTTSESGNESRTMSEPSKESRTGTTSEAGVDPGPGTTSEPGVEPGPGTTSEPGVDPGPGTTSEPGRGRSSESSGEVAISASTDPAPKPLPISDPTLDQNLTPDPDANQNPTGGHGTERPRKRSRVQAAASRLLPISSGASESCSEVLHRMNQDQVSHQVKSDWLICKYGNKLMGNQDGGQRRYDYVSQKLRELGRFLLAAKSLDGGVRTLQDVLAPGRLGLALAAARQASGNRWSRPPLAVKTTLRTVCEIAIGESLQDGDWEAAAHTTDFYHLLGREWDQLGLHTPHPHPASLGGGAKSRKPAVQSASDKTCKEAEPELSNHRPDAVSQSSDPRLTVVPPESRLQPPATVPVVPRKARRRPWSSLEKEAVWRQLGVHVLVQSVPGKEVCQRCLDLEPVLRGRHWKDIKNQVHNQIQSQKKQQFHAQMDRLEDQEHQDQNLEQELEGPAGEHQLSHKKKKKQQFHLDQNQNQDQDLPQVHKKELCHPRLDLPDQGPVQKRTLYQLDQQSSALDRDPLYGPDQNQNLGPYPLPHRTLGPHMDQLLSRTDWTEDTLSQHFPLSSSANQHPGHAHF